MNKKIKRYLDEIEKTEKKIAELQAYIKGVRAALKAEQETEMIRSLRGLKLNDHELYELLNGIQEGTIVFQEKETEEIENEEMEKLM